MANPCWSTLVAERGRGCQGRLSRRRDATGNRPAIDYLDKTACCCSVRRDSGGFLSSQGAHGPRVWGFLLVGPCGHGGSCLAGEDVRGGPGGWRDGRLMSDRDANPVMPSQVKADESLFDRF